VAAHNRRTGSLSILPMPKSPHVLTRTVKALKSIPPAAAPSKTQFHEARAALGETFGTKKAKAAIKAQERNVVDVGAMEGVMGYVMDSIDKGAGGLMSTGSSTTLRLRLTLSDTLFRRLEEAKDAADQNRLIPPFNATTMDPSDVYPLHDIVSEAEWKALSVTAFDDANDDKERIALLPFRYSKWLTNHLSNISQEAGKSKKKRMFEYFRCPTFCLFS
jgi:DNA-directed RNA polymerase I subunit RPA49